MNTAIDVNQLSVTLGDRHILHDINVSVPVGKITTLIGPNGCGKSTLLRSMIGYIHSPRECVTILGKPLQSYSQNELARQMAFLPQVPNMPKDMTVEELVYCGRYPYQMWWKNTAKEDREIVDYALGITKTNHLRNQLIPSLSGGERQRVWIAMALAQQPKLLVLDEPTTYLDINHQLEIMELLKRLNDEQGYPFIALPRLNYLYDEDANGAFLIRNSNNYHINTESDYMQVHFQLSCPQPVKGDVYVNGDWTYDRFLPQYKMAYDEESKSYQTVIPLKLGYYSYQYIVLNENGRTEIMPTEGSYYQTENTYQALVYYREQGGRADKLVGYTSFKFKAR